MRVVNVPMRRLLLGGDLAKHQRALTIRRELGD